MFGRWENRAREKGARLNLAKVEGLRARASLRHVWIGDFDGHGDDDDAHLRPWPRRFASALMAVRLSCSSASRFLLLLLLLVAIAIACIFLPIEKALSLSVSLDISVYVYVWK